MASEIRVDKINSLSGVGTVTLSPTGVDIAGITTAATLRATTGIVTSLTAGSLTSLGAVSGTTGTFSGAVSGTTGTFSGAVSGTTGTFTGDVDIADKIVHTGDTNTALRFPAADTVTVETAGSERLRIDSSGRFLLNMSTSVTGGKFQVDNQFNTFFATINDATGCVLQLEKTRSTSAGSYTIVQDGDTLGELQFKGSNGSASVIGANIKAVVNGTPGSGNDLPTDLTFRTMPDGSGSTIERLRIDSSGRVLIATNAATGASANADDLKIGNVDSGSQRGLTIGSALAANIRFADAADDTAGAIIYNHSSNNLQFWAGSGQRATIDADGIKFGSDTAAANALDDYEEGTFTPSVSSGLSAGQIAYNSRSGKYTKVGNTVTLTFHMNISSATLDSGALKFGNFPFTSANVSHTAGGMWRIFTTGNISSDVSYKIIGNSTDVQVISHAGDAVAANSTSIDQGNRQFAYWGFYYIS